MRRRRGHGDASLYLVRCRTVSVPTLDDLFEEMRRGRIFECSLRAKGGQLYGLTDGRDVYIDPRPAVLEFVVHELIHRRHPRYSERTVSAKARRLVVAMDEATKARWWRAYQRIKRRGKPTGLEDE